MGYLHIDNLYKALDILMFKELFAMEKIHGTSAHIAWKDGEVSFFSGGEKHESFVKLFDPVALKEKFTLMGNPSMIVFGEAYGGKCQGMSDTYGKSMKFVAFDVKVGDVWLSVPNADDAVRSLGLEFVHYEKLRAEMDVLDFHRNAHSVQAIRNGIVETMPREGIVLRPLIELRKNNGERLIAKYKREDFRETKTPRELDPEKMKVLEDANKIAEEWVTAMRLTHVLDKLGATELSQTGDVARAMLEDVKREAGSEVIWSREAERAVGTATAKLYKKRLTEVKQ